MDDLIIPTPRFRVGDTAWFYSTDMVKRQLPCPDCLGARKWTVTTPAGSTFEVACQRCAQEWMSLPHGVVDLNYPEYAVTVRSLVIAKVRIDTGNGEEWGGPVSYMDNPSGSGSVWYERGLFFTEAEARAAGEADAAVRNAKLVPQPVMLEKVISSQLKYRDAALDSYKTQLMRSLWAYKHLFDDLEGYLELENEGAGEDPKQALADLRSNLQWCLDYEKGTWGSPRDKGLLDDLLRAAQGVITAAQDPAGALDALEAAYAALKAALAALAAEGVTQAEARHAAFAAKTGAV